ncbi:MAG: universal stress protein [Halodesulfurarchaeum sp.]
MYRILLPLDDSKERADKQADYVIDLPCSDESVIAVLAHALTEEERDVPEAMQRVDRIETVRRTANRLEEVGVDYETRELSSPPAEGILDLISEEDIAEVVMGGRKRSPAEKAILGSVTQTVILNADVPVTVTGGQ